jgi:hypothetical protein
VKGTRTVAWTPRSYIATSMDSWSGSVALSVDVERGEAGGMERRRSCPPIETGLGSFAGFRFPPEVILLAVRWYLRYGLSYRDLEELLAERGIEVDHVTLYRWVQRFTPLLVEAARPRRHAVGDRWFVDETYVKGRRCVGCHESVGLPEISGDRISDCSCELVERGCDAESGAGIHAEFVVAASKVLHEGGASDGHAGGPVRLEAAHRAEPGLESAVVVLDAVVGVLGGVVMGVGDQVADRLGQRQATCRSSPQQVRRER